MGTALAYIKSVINIRNSTQSIFSQITSIKKQSYYLNQLFELLDYQSKSIPFSGSKKLSSIQNVFPYEERESYRSGMINFGLSHGIAGPLAVLSVAKLQGINRPGLAEAIGRLIEFFLCFVQEQPDGEVYCPSAITGEEYLKPALSISPHKRLSWCYGSLSILRSLFLASKAVSNEKIQIWAVNKAIRFTKMPLEKYLFESPTICHGYSGALILFESFYRDTHETAFLDAIERLQRKICSMNSMSYKYGFQNIDWIKGKYNIEDDLSLLSGASGVLLALSSRYCTCSYLLAHLLIT